MSSPATPPAPHAAAPGLLARLAGIVGPRGLVTDAREMEPYLVDWRRHYRGAALAVARPASTAEVAAVMRECVATRTCVVPQGGNTGMCGGATPSPAGNGIVVSLSRMNRIREVDALNNTLTAEAGCVLANVQEAALAADRFFPLSLGAEGSCQIGGNLATNAGGVNVLRYGNARELALGLEVVLHDGRVWNGLRGLRKDNTGYDLKDIFIGSEGTLGIITAAVLKLFPRPRARLTALVAVDAPAAAVELLARLRGACGERVSAFELVSRLCVELVVRHIPGSREPLGGRHPWHVLVELADAGPAPTLREDFERALSGAHEAGLARDAVIAESTAQAQALWRLRESIPEASRDEGLLYRHDISIAVSRLPAFIATAAAALERAFPGARIVCFGHLGDGNLHYNCLVPGRRHVDPAARDATDVSDLVLDIVREHGGSFSAEHGIGQSKRAALARYKSPLDIAIMRDLKRALDPLNLMNPGKVLPDG
ncbi:MAG: FAD-binding oxidoreductase [Burkholderiales bacterium]|nr:FAD-binding oxidoreductase [Burkholderiales bacterium]